MFITKHHVIMSQYWTTLKSPVQAFVAEKRKLAWSLRLVKREGLVLPPFQSFSTSLRCCDEKLRPREGVWSSG